MKSCLRRILGKAAIALPLAAIRLYQLLLSPWCGYCCRFQPSCSHYAAKALCDHGLIRGCVLTARRLLRCHPWGGQGFDPVPEKN